MKKILLCAALILSGLIFLVSQNGNFTASAQVNGKARQSASSAPDRNADLALANTIRELTNRSTDGLNLRKNAAGETELNLQNGFQNLMLSRIEPDGEPVAACVTSLGEANAFFGRNLETGEAVRQTVIKQDKIGALAARHGMSEGEFLFFQNMIAQADQNLIQTPNSATITINNADGAGEGFNDTTAITAEGSNNAATLGQQRLNLFNYAAGIWGAFLDSKVPIIINSKFDPLTPCSSGGGVLGSSGATGLSADFPNAPIANTFYPTALASKLSGVDRNGATAEINATFNSSIDTACLGTGTKFYYGLDNTTPSGRVNLLVVLLHEFGHGLGFQYFGNGTTGVLPNGIPDIFSRLTYDRSVGKYWSNMTDAERVASATNSGNVLWDGANVKIASNFLTAGRETATGRVQLYTPAAYEAGSSISHWDTGSFPNLLMEPAINYNLPLTLDLTRQQMRDIGWYRDTNLDLVADTITNVTPSANVLAVGSTATVTWTNTGGFNRNVTIELSNDGGTTFPVLIASNVANSGSYTFTVPNNLSSQSQLRVREYDFTAPLGSSANFTISAATAAPATISGRVLYGSGRYFSNRIMLKLEAPGFETRYVTINSLGYFRFSNVPANAVYTISIVGKKYVFAPQTVSASSGNVSGLIFTAQP